MRRLLLALLLACSGVVLLAPAPAFACSCVQMGFGERFDSADSVLTGSLIRVEPAGGGSTQRFLVEVDRKYKGAETAGTVEISTADSSASCGVEGLQPGTSYVFFLAEDRGVLTANGCLGVLELTPALERRLERRGDPVTVEQPEPAVLTRVAEAQPRRFRHLALPGGVMVIVGLVGLVLVRTFARD